MFGKKVIVLAAAILAISLWGCSADFEAENNQAAGGTGTAVVDNSSVGAANCIGCHEVLDIANSTTVVADYLAGKHVIHSTHVDAADDCALKCHDPFGDGRSLETYIKVGGPYDPTDPAKVAETPVVGGAPVAVEADYLTANGLAAVTCETCHGGGGDHVNGAAIPYKTPDYNRCGQCHNSDFFHNGYHPEADNIVEDYTSSKHFSGAIRNSAICVKCHTDAGAKLYKDDDTVGALSLTTPVAESNSIQCRTCHDSHNNGELLEAETTGIASAEYNTCTNCHQRHDAQIGLIATGIQQLPGTATPDGASGDLVFHAGSWDRVISSTHWDDPATSYQQALIDAGGVSSNVDQTTVIVEGYAIDPTDERACRNCHNVHGADATINKQWASSAHGSHIRDYKESAAILTYPSTLDQVAAVRAAGPNGADHALPHYDWDSTYRADDGDKTDLDTLPDLDRGSCQMCHTATGAKNYLKSLISLNDSDTLNDVVYDPANNDFSHLVGWVSHTPTTDPTTATVSSGQNELIYCWACHSNNSGALRNPGAITISSYTVDTVNPTLPDLGKSNVCVNCHGGRGNMDSYNLTAIPSTDMSALMPGFGPGTKNVTATHYFAAAASIYQAQTRVGYEYPGLSYADKPYYAHKGIGLNSDSPETGSGPCAACHMTDKNHTLSVVEKNGSGVITALKGTICVTCHSGKHALFVAQELVGTTQNIWNAAAAAAIPTVVIQQMADDTAAELEHEAEGFHEALAILEQQLIAKGLTFTGSYPYFSGASWVNEGTFGAAHNFNYLHHEPGAYAHNRFYAKRLIFDSIDWLDGDNWNTTVDPAVPGTDGNNLDGIINIDIVANAKAAAWLNAADTADPTATPPVTVGDANRP
ncbi:MAG: multiheme c-type cytochrome [Thermodesulfobacteriota bacterium]